MIGLPLLLSVEERLLKLFLIDSFGEFEEGAQVEGDERDVIAEKLLVGETVEFS